MIGFYRKFIPNSCSTLESVVLNSGIKISFVDSRITVEIPFASTNSLFYKKNRDCLEISNDLRLLHDKDDTLDSSGICSLLMLGAAVPPLTPFENIKAFIPGFTYEINPNSFVIQSQPSTQWSAFSASDNTMTVPEQVSAISNVLDLRLKKSCPSQNPVVLFSGGIDSSVIANRIASMGWEKATLLHCSFGKNDRETDVAIAINKAFQIPLDIHYWDVNAGFECLEKAASLYAQPFCDDSCVPTHSLSKAVIQGYGRNRVILDGTGADGAFGLFGKAKQIQMLYRLPLIVYRIASACYDRFELWDKPTRMEFFLRVLKRAFFLSALPTSIAQNSLFNIVYFSPKKDIETVDLCCRNWIYSVSKTRKNEEMIPLMDMGLTCTGIYAQKNKWPLSHAGFQVEYPYLSHEMLDLALNHARFWPGSSIPKNALKQLIAGAVPADLIYRQKSGFTAPLSQQYLHPTFIEALYMLTDTNSPLHEIVNQKNLARLTKRLTSRAELPTKTFETLWAIAFLNSWLTQAKAVSHELRQDIQQV
jgi:asparagine synthetase B (glutamine-hydrolysing)